MLRAHRIYIPKWLREKIFKIVDRSHLGMTKAKQALRSKVHWFNMDKDIESFFFVPFVPKIVKTQKSPPVEMNELPEVPWNSIAANFYGPLQTGEKLLLLVDYYSKFPVIEISKNTDSRSNGGENFVRRKILSDQNCVRRSLVR